MDKDRFPTWPDGTPRLLKPGEYVGYKHEVIKGQHVVTPIIKYEPKKNPLQDSHRIRIAS